MQWLIDLVAERVIATIGIPPTYIDRGDPATPDFDEGDLTRDATWRELDLSGIVPAGATAISMSAIVFYGSLGKRVYFRRHGNANAAAFAGLKTQIVGVEILGDFTVAVDSDRKIDYFTDAGLGATIDLTIKGWWL